MAREAISLALALTLAPTLALILALALALAQTLTTHDPLATEPSATLMMASVGDGAVRLTVCG